MNELNQSILKVLQGTSKTQGLTLTAIQIQVSTLTKKAQQRGTILQGVQNLLLNHKVSYYYDFVYPCHVKIYYLTKRV